MPAVVPLLSPLTPRQEMLHQVRNHLTFIAGTAHSLRRHLQQGEIDLQQAAERLERLERAVWAVDTLLAESDT